MLIGRKPGGLADQLEELVPYEVEGVDEKNDETFGALGDVSGTDAVPR